MANVLVAGASGGIGKAIIQQLNQQNHPIRALVRNQAKLGDQALNDVFLADARGHRQIGKLPASVDSRRLSPNNTQFIFDHFSSDQTHLLRSFCHGR